MFWSNGITMTQTGVDPYDDVKFRWFSPFARLAALIAFRVGHELNHCVCAQHTLIDPRDFQTIRALSRDGFSEREKQNASLFKLMALPLRSRSV